MLASDFFNLGRMDCLRNTVANPTGAGAQTSQDYNEYMNGYNSTLSQVKGMWTKELVGVGKKVSDLYDACMERKKPRTTGELKRRLSKIIYRLRDDMAFTTTFLEDRLFLADVQDIQEINQDDAINYSMAFNVLQIERKSPEDLLFFKGFIIALIDSIKQKGYFRQTESPSETECFFTQTFLTSAVYAPPTSSLLPEDQMYLKFVQALHLIGEEALAERRGELYNIVQERRRVGTEKMKQISKIGSRYRYGIELK